MKKEEIKKLKETINNKLDRYANKNVVKAGEFSDLLKKIHNLDYRDRTKLREEYNRINNVAFKKGVKLDEYNPAVYFEKKPSTKKSKPDSTDKDVIEKKVSVLYENVEDRFKFFPRHIFLLLENDEDETYNILLLYNHENEPFFLRKTKKEIKASGSSECNVYQLEDFIDGVESGELRDKNYIVFFTFKVKSSPQTYIDYIFSILEGYFNISQIKIGDTDENLTYINQIDEIKKELEYLMMVEFINKDLDHHILKAIKLLFGANKTNQIHYQINSKGFTDSTVISVQPFSNFENPQKYIIKIGDRNNTKLLNEEEKFRKHVETTDSSYSIEVQKTEKCFAIRYHYATSDSEIESKSFGGILRSSKNDYPISKRKSYIKKLFKTPTYKRWDSTELDDININYKNYRDFINFDAIKNHLNKIYDSSDVDQLEVVDIFKKAKKIKLEGNTQICHGDLHTENFFIDENENAYLIDFGDVGRHHNIIDYAMLETSIKLNHTPNYIPNDKLYKLEKELLNDNTFNSNYSFKSTQRQDLVNVYSLITTIRELAADKINNPNEYFYSLFMLTFRQIRYDDLNQLYAIEISEQIGRKLLKELC